MVKGKKLIEFLDHGIFPGFTCVVIGYAPEEALQYLTDNSGRGKLFKKKQVQYWIDGLNEVPLTDAYSGITYKTFSKQNIDLYYVILPKPFEGKVDDYNTLAHELVHLTQFLLPTFLDVSKEIEGQAYLHSYLFEKICRKMGFK